MIKNLDIPILWGQKHRDLQYESTMFKDANQEHSWIATGHLVNALRIEMHPVKSPYPWMQYVLDFFPELKDVSFCFSKFPPGTYFPMHIDRYAYFSKHNQVTQTSSIQRYVLFLENADKGHILQIGDTMYHGWKAGLCVGWQYDTPHLAANLGLLDRYTLQITGVEK